MNRRWDKALVATVVMAVIGAIVARLIEHFALRDVPHVMDEMAYWLQARMLADGIVKLPAQLPRAAFAMWLVDDRAARYAVFPPGWPLLLGVAGKLHLQLWLNPVLHGVTTVAVGFLAKRLGGARAQVAASAIYAFSPQALLLAASLMSHGLVALSAVLVVGAGVAAAAGDLSTRTTLVAGIGLAAVATTRPLCALALGLTLLAFVALALARRVRIRIKHLVVFAAPVIVGAVGLFAYNHAITGSATRFPQNVYFEEHGAPVDLPGFRYQPGCNDLGLGPSHGCDATPHTMKSALSNTGDNIKAWFFLAGGTALVFLAALAAFVKRGVRAVVAICWALVALVIVLYGLYWNAGTCYGARFYHAALPILASLAGLGLTAFRRPWFRWVVVGTAVLWSGWNVFVLGMALGEVGNDYFGVDDRFARLASRWSDGDAVVMVAFTQDGHPRRPTYVWTLSLPDIYFMNSVRAGSALWLNRPELDGPLVFAKYHPALVPELRQRFANRRFFLYIVRDTDPQGDLLVPFDDSRYAMPSSLPRPPDNFDGFIIPRSELP